MNKGKEGVRVKPLKVSEIAAIKKGLKERLEQLKNFLQEQIAFPRQEPDLCDQSAQETDLAISLVQHRKAKGEALAIEAALVRIERKEFGICLGCGEPIPKGRLQAVPTSVLCIGCQLEREQRMRRYRHPQTATYAFVS